MVAYPGDHRIQQMIICIPNGMVREEIPGMDKMKESSDLIMRHRHKSSPEPQINVKNRAQGQVNPQLCPAGLVRFKKIKIYFIDKMQYN